MLRTYCLARLLSCNSIKNSSASKHRMREKHEVLDKVLLRKNNLADGDGSQRDCPFCWIKVCELMASSSRGVFELEQILCGNRSLWGLIVSLEINLIVVCSQLQL